MDVLVRVSARVYPTESLGAVIKAMTSIFPSDASMVDVQEVVETVQLDIDPTVHYEIHPRQATLESREMQILERFHELVRKELIVESARSVLQRSKGLHPDGTGETRFLLHKQTAVRGKVHFAEPGESPLGPMQVSIFSDDIDKIIDWLSPPTKDGAVQEIYQSPPA